MTRPVVALALLMGCAAAAEAQSPVVLEGKAVEAGTGSPVSGAVVRIAAETGAGSTSGSRSAVTDDAGAWRIGPLAGSAHELIVEHAAYATARVTATGGDPLRIVLTPRPFPLDGLVVTGSRRLQRLADAAVATEVVDRSEIERTGAADLADVLVERTGVALEGGHPIGSGLMMQGLGSERVLVLVDGQPLVGRIAGTLDVSRIPTSIVDRVEIVKGPQSTLYGSEAMGGVINVITSEPGRGAWVGEARVTGGSRGRLDASGGVSGAAGSAGVTLDGGRRHIELVPGHAGEAGTYVSRIDGAARIDWRANQKLSLTASAFLVGESQRWRSGVLYQFADNLEWSARAGARWTRGRHRVASTLYATSFRHLARAATAPEPVAGSGDREEQRLVEAELLYGTGAGALAIDAGVELRRESIRSDRVKGESRVLHAAEPFAQATWTIGPVSIVPGVRASWSERWGSHITPRVAAMYRPTASISLRASVARGYRAPAFKELYLEFLNSAPGAGYRVQGNPDLRPETSTNASASVEWSGDRVYARAQYFENRFDDFIETRELPASDGLRVFTYGNIANGLTRGIEVEAGATWRAFRADAGWSHLVARDRSNDRTLLGRPPHSARATLSWASPIGLRASLTALHTDRTAVAFDENGEPVDRAAFTRVDARVAQALPRGLELSAGVDNVAGARPAGWPGFAGTQFHFGLSWRGERRTP